MQCALHAARRWHPKWAVTERIGLGVIAEADAGTESRGTGGQFETVADDVVTTAGLVCWVWVYGCQWNSLDDLCWRGRKNRRSEEHTSELQSLMRISYAVFCLKKKTKLSSEYIEINVTQIIQTYLLEVIT